MTAVPKHCWWFSATAAGRPHPLNLLPLNPLSLGQRIAFPWTTDRLMKVLPSLALIAMVVALQAQENPIPNANADPDGQYEPGRAVARISILNGDVSVRRGDSGDVVAAALNAPIMGDDRLLTGSSARAE